MNGAPPSLAPETSVFLNCPFDAAFAAQRNALVLACVQSGFYPVMADSSGRSGRSRLERILDGLMGSRYSIHDLSRCRGEGDANLARFNMPLELGMAMALRASQTERAVHEYLILVPDDRDTYRRFVSDLAGFDPPGYDGTPERIALEALAWLQTAAEAPAALSPRDLLPKLPLFASAMDGLATEWKGGTVPWDYVVAAAADIAAP